LGVVVTARRAPGRATYAAASPAASSPTATVIAAPALATTTSAAIPAALATAAAALVGKDAITVHAHVTRGGRAVQAISDVIVEAIVVVTLVIRIHERGWLFARPTNVSDRIFINHRRCGRPLTERWARIIHHG